MDSASSVRDRFITLSHGIQCRLLQDVEASGQES